MESIIIYPKNKKQTSLLQAMLEEMKVPFEIGKSNEPFNLTEEEYRVKIDKSIEQAESGDTITLTKIQQKQLLVL